MKSKECGDPGVRGWGHVSLPPPDLPVCIVILFGGVLAMVRANQANFPAKNSQIRLDSVALQLKLVWVKAGNSGI